MWLLIKGFKIWFWQDGYYAEEIITEAFCESKLNYIHMNPVRARIAEKEEENINSNCGDYYGNREGALEIEYL